MIRAHRMLSVKVKSQGSISAQCAKQQSCEQRAVMSANMLTTAEHSLDKLAIETLEAGTVTDVSTGHLE